MQDVQVQVEMAVNKRNAPEKKSCASVGTQTVVLLDKKTAQVPFVVSFSSLSQCENAPVDNLMILNPPPINTSDGESEVGQSTNHKQFSALSCETDTFSVSLAGGSGLQSSQEQGCSQQLPEYEDNIQVERREEGANCKVMEYGAVSPHQEQGQGKGQMLEGKNKERTHSICRAGIKNLAKMKQMMGTTEISIKVKLRRTATGEVWEVASIQDKDETLSLVSSVRQGCSTQKTQANNCNNTSSSTNLVQKPEAGNPQPPIASSPVTSPESYLLSVGGVDMSHSSELDSERELDPPQPQTSVEETDEQIEMLLEDIMKGLNILPNLDGDCKTLQAGHDWEPAFNQTAGNDLRRSPIYAASSTAEPVFYQDVEPARGRPSAHTDLYCHAQSPSGFSNPLAGHPSVATQQDSQINFPVRSEGLGQTDPLGCPGMLVSKYQCPETSTPASALPLACTSGQKLHHQQQCSEKDQTVFGLLPLQEADGHSGHPFLLPWMDDMRLPQCLSPLELFTSKEKDQNLPSDPRNREKQAQSQLRQPPWLAETPQSLQFPFSAIKENSKVSLLCKNTNCSSACCQWYLEANQKIIGARKQSSSVKSSDPEKVDGLKRKCDTKGHDVIRKKRRRRRQIELLQDFSKVFLAPKNVTNGKNTGTCIEKEPTRGPNIKSAEETWIRARGFVKRYLQRTCNTVPEMSHKSAGDYRDMNKLGTALPKRKCGRLRKITVEQKPSTQISANSKDESHEEAREYLDTRALAPEGHAQRQRCRKKKNKSEEDVEEDPPKKKTPRCSNITNPRNPGTSKPPWMASLTEVQKPIQRRHPKRKNVKDSQEETQLSKNSKGGKEGGTGFTSIMKTIIDSTQTSNAEHQEAISVDENNNQPFNTSPAHSNKTDQDDNTTSSIEMLHLSGEKGHPVSSKDSLEEELGEVSPNREQKNSDEGGVCCGGDFKGDQPVSTDGRASYCSSLQSNVSVDHNSQPQTPQRTVLLVDQREEDDEEEEDIDVVLYSPDNGAPRGAVLNSMVVTVDEEEEDVNEIDVTGDEA
ncbi:uncharacterized protein LOC101170325 isoform X3 [Oryzias latipes]|nr:uncharacterized protein LOC101170325 isoform X3 [Oryzias latipes]